MRRVSRGSPGVRTACIVGSIVVLVVACTSGAPLPPPTATPPPGVAGRPNILLILTDDQTLTEMGHMATVRSELAGKGMTFRNGFVVNPLCCPSRTSILTGRYSHSTGVYRNIPPGGGFQTFGSQDRSTIATWLQQDGYQTALIGKYLNGYVTPSYVPPGWNTWKAFSSTGYVNYTISDQGRTVRYPGSPTTYSTTVLGDDAVRFIASVAPGTPLFLYFAPKAPHAPATPEAKYAHALPDLPLSRPPNYNERDVSDKPAWLRNTRPLTPAELASNDAFVLHQNQTVLSVDDQVRAILDALAATGRLSNTFIVYTSDNGLENGSHRLLYKGVPYEESVHVPLIIRYDPITKLHATGSDVLALNVDLAPTFAAVAGIPAPGAEGSSLLPILEGRPVKWRDVFVIEHVIEVTNGVPTFCAVRTARYKYVLYGGGEEELYDLQTDPYELQSEAGTPTFAAIRSELRSDLMRLCLPKPPGWQP
jgi:arylsulfatase A-like enzyme